MPTTFSDGSVHTLPTGSYAGIIIDASTTVNMTGATSTGPNGFHNYPPAAFSDAESGIPAVSMTGQSVLNVTGSGTLTGGSSDAGITTESDGTPGLACAACFGAAPCILSTPVNVGGTIYGDSIRLGGNGTLTGGSHNPASATGTVPSFGAPAVIAQWPASFVLTDSITLQGGDSESTLPGAAGLVLTLGGTVGATLGGISFTPVVKGGSGASTGLSASIANQGTGTVDLAGGPWPDGIALNFAAGSTFRVSWGLGGPYTLTTSSISGLLSDGSTVSIPLTVSGSPTITNAAGSSEMAF